jgi:tetratricopeptide (TPR) repeat protein
VNLQTQEQEAEAFDELKQAMDAGLENLAAYFDLGWLYIQLGDHENAVSSLAKAVNHADYALGARLLTGQSLRILGKLDEAAIEFLEALRIADALVVSSRDAVNLKQLYDPIIEAEAQKTDLEAKEKLCENIDSLLMRSDWRSRLSQVRRELPILIEGGPPRPIGEILTEVSSSEVVESIALIHKLARDGHIRSGMEEAFYALKYAPTYLPLHIYMGELLLQQELLPAAIAKFTVVGQTYSARGESSLAIELFRRIIHLAPMDLSARYRLIGELVNTGNSDEAIEEYLKLADVHYNLADFRLARKTFSEALQMAQKAQVDKSLRVQILHQMADIDVQSLDWRQALKVYEHIRSLQPDDHRARARLVELNFRLGQEDQAMTEMDHFLSRFMTGGQVDEAIRFLEGLVQEVPGQKVIQNRLIELYRQEGRKSDAIKFLDDMGQRLMLVGDRAGAMEVVEMILALDPPNVDEYKKLMGRIRQ